MRSAPLDHLDCPHAPACPGCPLHDAPYAAQLAQKGAHVSGVVAAFRAFAEVAVASVRPADPVLAYRRRAKVVVQGARLGLFAGEHSVVDIPACKVVAPALAAVLTEVRRAAPFSTPVRAVDAREVPGGVLLTLVVDDDAPQAEVAREVERLERCVSGVVSLAVSRRPRRSAQLLGRATEVLSGPKEVRVAVPLGGAYAYATHGAFTQAHAAQEAALHGAIAALGDQTTPAASGLRVLELFAGSGALSLGLAARGARAVAVESFKPAAHYVEQAAWEQSLEVTAVEGDAEHAALRLASEGARFDLVVVNPPRRGLSPSLRAVLPVLTTGSLAYVSCSPETLARDVSHLGSVGLRVNALVPYDMMPWTTQVETLCVLAPGAPVPLDVLYEDERLIAVDKPPHLPTTPQGEHRGSLLEQVRRLRGAEHAVPVHRLDATTSGVCLFARRPEHVEALARALTEGKKQYTVLCRGITRGKGVVNRALRTGGRMQAARTRYFRTEVVGGHSLVRAEPDQGRKHQIRRHLAAVGHPVLGDARHGDAASNEYLFKRHGLDRAGIHCARIELGASCAGLVLSAPLAPDLELSLRSLRDRGAPSDSLDLS